MKSKTNNNLVIGITEATELIKSETIRRILPGAFHEMNNHISAIMGYSELLLGEITVSKTSMSDLQNIQDGAQHLEELVGLISRLSQSDDRSLICEFSLEFAIEETIIMLKKLSTNRRIRMRFSRSPSQPSTAFGDETNFKIAISSLLLGLLEHSDCGAEIAISATLYSDEEAVVCASCCGGTQESGIPSPAAMLLKSVVSTETAMIACRSMIEAMGGQLLIASEYGKMIGFSVVLPLAKESNEDSFISAT